MVEDIQARSKVLVLFVSRNNANLVERSTVNTNDILVLGEKINDSLIVSE